MNTLIIPVGNIASGKSTLTKNLVKEGYFVVSRDSIRYSIKAGTYIFDRNIESSVFEIEWSMFITFLERGWNIVLDEVNVSRKDRKKYIETAKRYNYEVRAVVLPRISKEESIKRRMADNHGTTTAETWDMVWTNFNNKYQEPTLDEGFDIIETVEKGETNESVH